jgi:hypothetical protein
MGHPQILGRYIREIEDKGNRALPGKPGAARETWALLGPFADAQGDTLNTKWMHLP